MACQALPANMSESNDSEEPHPLAVIESVEAYVLQHHQCCFDWRSVLQTHACLRPSRLGGAVVDNIDQCMDFDVLNENAPWGSNSSVLIDATQQLFAG